MSAQPTAMQVNFAIVSCSCSMFRLSDFAENNKEIIPIEKYQYVISINLDIKKESKIIVIKVNSVINELLETTRELMTIESTNEFLVNNLDKVIINRADGSHGIPDQLGIQLFSICLSNLRGMLAVKLENTPYSNLVFPLVDASQFVPKPVSAVG